jgi:hypothetical protein
MILASWWVLGYTLGAAVVVVVAALLIAILLVARNIERLAGQALGVAAQIEAATRPIWSLAGANEIVEEMAASARAIEAQITTIADELAPEGVAGSEGGVP